MTGRGLQDWKKFCVIPKSNFQKSTEYMNNLNTKYKQWQIYLLWPLKKLLYSKLFNCPKDCASLWRDIGWNGTACVLSVHSVCKIHRDCKKVKSSRYWLGVAQRVGRGIALLFHDRGTRMGWVVSSTTRPHFTTEIDPVLILQEAGSALGLTCTGGKFHPHRESIQDRSARSQSLYRLSYPAHTQRF